MDRMTARVKHQGRMSATLWPVHGSPRTEGRVDRSILLIRSLTVEYGVYSSFISVDRAQFVIQRLKYAPDLVPEVAKNASWRRLNLRMVGPFSCFIAAPKANYKQYQMKVKVLHAIGCVIPMKVPGRTRP